MLDGVFGYLLSNYCYSIVVYYLRFCFLLILLLEVPRLLSYYICSFYFDLMSIFGV